MGDKNYQQEVTGTGYAYTTPTTELTFGHAIQALKEGKKVCRKGWNGKGMWLYLVPGSTFNVAEGRLLAKHLPVGEEVVYNPHIDMKATDGSHFVWNPNQLDMLAEDWEILHSEVVQSAVDASQAR